MAFVLSFYFVFIFFPVFEHICSLYVLTYDRIMFSCQDKFKNIFLFILVYFTAIKWEFNPIQ